MLLAAGDPAAAMGETMAAARALDRRVTLGSMLTLDEQIGRQMNPQRFGMPCGGAGQDPRCVRAKSSSYIALPSGPVGPSKRTDE